MLLAACHGVAVSEPTKAGLMQLLFDFSMLVRFLLCACRALFLNTVSEPQA